jgi:hypothetical protein
MNGVDDSLLSQLGHANVGTKRYALASHLSSVGVPKLMPAKRRRTPARSAGW